MLSYERRNTLLKELGYDSYQMYRESDHWRAIRRTVLGEFPRCRVCRHDASEIHHRDYERATLLGTNRIGLISLCRTCHDLIEFHAGGRKRTLEEANERLDLLCQRLNGSTRPKLQSPPPSAQRTTKIKGPPQEQGRLRQEFIEYACSRGVTARHKGSKKKRIYLLFTGIGYVGRYNDGTKKLWFRGCNPKSPILVRSCQEAVDRVLANQVSN